MRKKQYLAAIRPLDGALAMSTMRFADEVVPQSELDLPGRGAKPEPKQLKLATQIIDSLATDWDPKRYHDTYTEELKSLIEAKAKGKEIVAEEEAPAEASVIDLMAALEASLEAARKGGGRKLAKEVAKVADRLAAEQSADDDDSAPEKRSAAKKPAAKKKAPTKKAAARTTTRKKSA
jgi:DNA end-binding protein Ku